MKCVTANKITFMSVLTHNYTTNKTLISKYLIFVKLAIILVLSNIKYIIYFFLIFYKFDKYFKYLLIHLIANTIATYFCKFHFLLISTISIIPRSTYLSF